MNKKAWLGPKGVMTKQLLSGRANISQHMATYIRNARRESANNSKRREIDFESTMAVTYYRMMVTHALTIREHTYCDRDDVKYGEISSKIATPPDTRRVLMWSNAENMNSTVPFT